PTTMPSAADTFLQNVLRSGLLKKEQLDEALRAVPEADRTDAERLANHLVRQGRLSPFQAHKLRRGAVVGLILGSYQIHTPIAKGGMGAIYLATDSRNGRHVAIKV